MSVHEQTFGDITVAPQATVRAIPERINPTRRKLGSLQAGRGIAALMVVLCHIGDFLGKIPGLWRNLTFYRWLSPGGLGVDFFFILSGLVILLAHWDDIGVWKHVRVFLWKRFRRIYPIYWIFLIPVVLKQYHVDTGHVLEQRNPIVTLSSFLLVHVGTLGVHMPVSWTLFHEVLFYALFSVVIMNRKAGSFLLVCWFCVSFIIFPFSAVVDEPASYLEFLFSPLHCLFGFGILIGLLIQNGLAPTQRWLQLLGVAIFGVAFYFNWVHSRGYIWVRILGNVGVALVILVATARDRLTSRQVPVVLLFLGDASYSIYLIHFMVISAIARPGFVFDQRWHLPLLAWCGFMFFASVACGIAAHIYIERPLLKLLPR